MCHPSTCIDSSERRLCPRIRRATVQPVNALAATQTTRRSSVREWLFYKPPALRYAPASVDAQLEGYHRAATLSNQSLRFLAFEIPKFPYLHLPKFTRNHYREPLVGKKSFGEFSIFSWFFISFWYIIREYRGGTKSTEKEKCIMEKKAKLKVAPSTPIEPGYSKNNNAWLSMFYSSIVPGKSKGGFMHVPTNFTCRR